MRLAASLFVVAFAIAAPASAKRHSLLSYGTGFRDAMVIYDGEKFSIYVHPKDQALLIEPAMSMLGRKFPLQTYRAVAEQFVAPLNCGIPSVDAITVTGAAWEASYECPAGVNLREIVKAQRASLKRGEAIQP